MHAVTMFPYQWHLDQIKTALAKQRRQKAFLADIWQVTPKTVSCYLNGKIAISADKIYKASVFLDIEWGMDIIFNENYTGGCHGNSDTSTSNPVGG